MPNTHARFHLSLAWIILVVLAAGLLLPACGDDDSADHSPAGDPQSAVDAVPRTLVIWHGYNEDRHAALLSLAAEFAAAHPATSVDVQRFEVDALRDEFEQAVLAGAGPDILFGQPEWISPLVNGGFVQPVSLELLDLLEDTLAEFAVEGIQLQGVPYAVPVGIEIPTLYYRRSEILISLPQSYQDIILLGRFRVDFKPSFFMASGLFFSNGGLLFDEAGELLLTPVGASQALQRAQLMADMPGFNFPEDAARFIAGDANVLLSTSADYLELQAALGDDLGIHPLPPIVGQNWRTFVRVQPMLFSLNSTQESSAAAEDFARFLLEPEQQQRWFTELSFTPITPEVLPDEELAIAWTLAARNGLAEPIEPRYYDIVRPVLDAAVQAVLLDGGEPEAVAEFLLGELETALADE